jgi:hypothetical protein
MCGSDLWQCIPVTALEALVGIVLNEKHFHAYTVPRMSDLQPGAFINRYMPNLFETTAIHNIQELAPCDYAYNWHAYNVSKAASRVAVNCNTMLKLLLVQALALLTMRQSALCVAVIFFWITLKSNILSTILLNTRVQTVLFVTIIQTCKLCTILERLSPGKIWSNYLTIRKQCCSLSSLTKPVFWLSFNKSSSVGRCSRSYSGSPSGSGQHQLRWQYLKLALR